MIFLTVFYSCEKEQEGVIDPVIPVYEKYDFNYEQIPSNLNDYFIRCVYFINDSIGFAGTLYGKILKTTDGGINWNGDSISFMNFNSIYFINNQIGFAVGGTDHDGGSGSIVYKTVDAGKTWIEKILPNSGSQLYSTFFIDDQIGFAIGLGSQFKSSDGGETWKQFTFDIPGTMLKITFIDSQIGFAAGSGNIYKTINQGVDWTLTNNQSDGGVLDLFFVNEKVGYAGGQKQMVKTTDGGDTWNIIKNSPTSIFFLHFADEYNGLAIGYDSWIGGDWGYKTYAMHITSNGGKSWEKIGNIEFDFRFSSSFYSKFEGYSIAPKKTFKLSFK